jgi:predicted O-methyltransferase YrrM
MKRPEQSGGYDLVVIGADKQDVLGYFQEGLRLCKKGGILMIKHAFAGGREVLFHTLVNIRTDEFDRVLNANEDGEDVRGLKRLYDWVEQDAGKTILMSGMPSGGDDGE